MNRPRYIILTALAIVIVGAGMLFVQRKETVPNKPLQVAELSISYSAVTHLADMLGYTRKENSLISLVPLAAGPDAVASLRSPSGAQVATIAVTPVVTMIAAGEEPVVLATTILSNQQVQLVTLAQTGITDDPRTLKGKKIGRVRNTVGEIYLSRLMTKAGLTATDVTLVDGRPADLVNLLVRGDIDAAVLWDPFVASAKRLYGSQIEKKAVRDRGALSVYIDKELYTLAYNIVSTKKKLVVNEEAAKSLLRALIATEEHITKNRADAQQKLETWLNLQPGDLDHFMQTTTFRVELDVPQMQKWLGEELVWLATVQEVKKPAADLRSYIDSSILSSVSADRVK